MFGQRTSRAQNGQPSQQLAVGMFRTSGHMNVPGLKSSMDTVSISAKLHAHLTLQPLGFCIAGCLLIGLLCLWAYIKCYRRVATCVPCNRGSDLPAQRRGIGVNRRRGKGRGRGSSGNVVASRLVLPISSLCHLVPSTSVTVASLREPPPVYSKLRGSSDRF